MSSSVYNLKITGFTVLMALAFQAQAQQEWQVFDFSVFSFNDYLEHEEPPSKSIRYAQRYDIYYKLDSSNTLYKVDSTLHEEFYFKEGVLVKLIRHKDSTFYPTPYVENYYYSSSQLDSVRTFEGKKSSSVIKYTYDEKGRILQIRDSSFLEEKIVKFTFKYAHLDSERPEQVYFYYNDRLSSELNTCYLSNGWKYLEERSNGNIRKRAFWHNGQLSHYWTFSNIDDNIYQSIYQRSESSPNFTIEKTFLPTGETISFNRYIFNENGDLDCSEIDYGDGNTVKFVYSRDKNYREERTLIIADGDLEDFRGSGTSYFKSIPESGPKK
jgi:hypothetical protein